MTQAQAAVAAASAIAAQERPVASYQSDAYNAGYISGRLKGGKRPAVTPDRTTGTQPDITAFWADQGLADGIAKLPPRTGVSLQVNDAVDGSAGVVIDGTSGAVTPFVLPVSGGNQYNAPLAAATGAGGAFGGGIEGLLMMEALEGNGARGQSQAPRVVYVTKKKKKKKGK